MITRTFITPAGNKFVITASPSTINTLVKELHLIAYSC